MNLNINLLRRAGAGLALFFLAACQGPPAAGLAVTRYANPGAGAGAVTAKAVEVAGAASLIYVSGNTPVPADPAAPEYGAAYWGDTEAQTASVLKKIAASLDEIGLGMADVVKIQVFLVAPGGAKLADLAGFGKGFARYFGAASGGQLPARTVVTVASLGRAGMLVEIEVTAVRPPGGQRR